MVDNLASNQTVRVRIPLSAYTITRTVRFYLVLFMLLLHYFKNISFIKYIATHWFNLGLLVLFVFINVVLMLHYLEVSLLVSTSVVIYVGVVAVLLFNGSKSGFIVSLTTFIKSTLDKRPPRFVFFLLILCWVSFGCLASSLYDPFTEISKEWWLHTFLSIDGMLIMALLPYNRFTKYFLWYGYISTILGTATLILLAVPMVTVRSNHQLSFLSVYTNPFVEFLLTYGEELKNFFIKTAECVGENGSVTNTPPSREARVTAVVNQGAPHLPTPYTTTMNSMRLASTANYSFMAGATTAAIYILSPRGKLVVLPGMAAGAVFGWFVTNGGGQ